MFINIPQICLVKKSHIQVYCCVQRASKYLPNTKNLSECVCNHFLERILPAAAPFTLSLTLLTSHRFPASVSSPGNGSAKVKKTQPETEWVTLMQMKPQRAVVS